MTRDTNEDPRRRLPAVDRLLDGAALRRVESLYGRDSTRVQAQRELAALRLRLAAPGPPSAAELAALLDDLPARVEAACARQEGPPLRRVLNATGIFLHTNLGRAPLPPAVAGALPQLLTAGCDLEIDLATGERGDRNARVARLLTAATGGEAALVVNNNAAALVLALSALAAGREVVVSRGELVEIGGSFRIPEILAAAGARLVEVGTTNRTRLADYAAAIGPATALLLKVQPSNYRVSGFVASVGEEALADLGRRRGVPVLADEGSGLLTPHPAPQLAGHASLAELIGWGVDLACGSGDKLLGGPQAGLIVGRRDLVARLHRHPLYRALRPDRGTLATLELVLRRRGRGAPLPLDGLWPDPASHRLRLDRAAASLGAAIVPAEAFVGGGAAPERSIVGEALALPGDEALLARLRGGRPPVVGYLREGRLLLDLRTVAEEDDEVLIAAVAQARATPAGVGA